MSLSDAEKNRLKRVGLSGLNKPKRTPKHPTKKAVVAVRWATTIPQKHVNHLKLVMQRILQEVKQVLLIGQIKFFGLVLVVQKNLPLNLKNILKVLNGDEG